MATVIQAQDKSGKYMKYDTKNKMKYILDYVHDPEKNQIRITGWNPSDESGKCI